MALPRQAQTRLIPAAKANEHGRPRTTVDLQSISADDYRALSSVPEIRISHGGRHMRDAFKHNWRAFLIYKFISSKR